MKTADELAVMINANADAIVSAISYKEVESYIYLETNYTDVDVFMDQAYRRKFRGYYIMRFTSDEFCDRFFELFQQQKHILRSFRDLSLDLYRVDGKHQLSFISKLLHTVDDSRPIFDSHISELFGFRRSAGPIEKRIIEDKNLLDYMQNVYRQIEDRGLIENVICAFDDKFPDKGLSFTKKVDFLLWKLSALPQLDKAAPQMIDIKPGRYRHFKGNEYEVLYVALHSETMEPMVVYRALYGEGRIWVRSLSMWNEDVIHDGVSCKRFTYISE